MRVPKYKYNSIKLEVNFMKNALVNDLDLFSPKSFFNDDWFNFGKYPIFGNNFANSPKVNVKETDKAYEIKIANPGFSKDETNIKIEDGVIYVSMTSESKEGDGDGKYHCKQWSKTSYSESWNLPENVIQEQITAKNNDGVLTITLPKKMVEPKKEESRTIEIE